MIVKAVNTLIPVRAEFLTEEFYGMTLCLKGILTALLEWVILSQQNILKYQKQKEFPFMMITYLHYFLKIRTKQ